MMADFDKGNFDSIKNTSGMEFWRLYELFKKKREAEKESKVKK